MSARVKRIVSKQEQGQGYTQTLIFYYFIITIWWRQPVMASFDVVGRRIGKNRKYVVQLHFICYIIQYNFLKVFLQGQSLLWVLTMKVKVKCLADLSSWSQGLECCCKVWRWSIINFGEQFLLIFTKMKSPRTVNASLLTNRQTDRQTNRSNYILCNWICGGRKVISVLILVMFHSLCNIVLSNFIFRIVPSQQEREEDWGSPKRVPDNHVRYSKLKVEHFVAKQTKGFTEINICFYISVSD